MSSTVRCVSPRGWHKTNHYHTTAYTTMSPFSSAKLSRFGHIHWSPESHNLVLLRMYFFSKILARSAPHGHRKAVISMPLERPLFLPIEFICKMALVSFCHTYWSVSCRRSKPVTLCHLLLRVSIRCNHCNYQPLLPYNKKQMTITLQGTATSLGFFTPGCWALRKSNHAKSH